MSYEVGTCGETYNLNQGYSKWATGTKVIRLDFGRQMFLVKKKKIHFKIIV